MRKADTSKAFQIGENMTHEVPWNKIILERFVELALLTPEQRERFQALAAAEGKSMTQFIVDLLEDCTRVQ